MPGKNVGTLIVGGGQAGLAMSAHLIRRGAPHVVLERRRIAERWRTERWDSLVANGPAWHDRFPAKTFSDVGADDFASKDSVAAYFERFAAEIGAPVRCGVEVRAVRRARRGGRFEVDTSDGPLEADNVVAATGPFQRPVIPAAAEGAPGLRQMHSSAYRNPDQLADGAVLVVGAGSSGAQIADELLRAGRRVYLSIGPHDRPPRRYRGRDFVWWLGVLGKWEAEATTASTEHVTIAVSGAHGGETVDFRRFAERGMTLLGRLSGCVDGVARFAPDLARNLARGDANYLSVLDEADAYVAAQGLDLPPEPEARRIAGDPACVVDPVLELDLEAAGVATVIWATGYTQDFSWLQVDAFDPAGKPAHQCGVSREPGVYFLGLPWLSMRGSSFIWGVWVDAERLAGHIVARASSGAAESEAAAHALA